MLVEFFEGLRNEETEKHDGILVWFNLFELVYGPPAVAFGSAVDIKNQFVVRVGREIEFFDFDFGVCRDNLSNDRRPAC